ncbi:hypothetical protein CVIRNUC_001679 [Coccomyxa viridis]|uniref:C2 domain-containing protein n=1 Tax=Coccomyxa viridis TaxID=1274662 RepID=A0AAV1HUQ8_9CHLO|nr:hypothetical protein CVIRNUC_001679 [Coccomyxa viridis]
MSEGPKVKGHLIITVAEASGKNKDDQLVWDPNFVEGFVKVEIRGEKGIKVKVQSTPKRVLANSINWQEELILDVLENANELRIMLCREKRSGTRTGTSVIAACGIFVNDIMDAVPIDKYFELFKPGQGGEGGFIRIGMDYVKSLKDKDGKAGDAKAQPLGYKPALSFKGYTPDNGAKREKANNSGKKKGGRILKVVVGAAVLAGAAFGALKLAENKGIKLELKRTPGVDTVQERKKKFPF